MDVEYELTEEDMHAFTTNQAKHSVGPTWKNVNQVGRWVIGALIFTWIVSLIVRDPAIQSILQTVTLLLLGAWVGIVLSALDVLRVTRNSVRNFFKDARNRFLIGPRRLSITADGLTIHSEGFRDYLPWSGVIDLAVTDTHVFVYNGSINAQVVPKRAFQDEQHFQEFVQLAKRYYEAAV